MSFAVGTAVRVKKVNPNSVAEKFACVGKTGKIVKPSKVGTNQYSQARKWVLDILPGRWFAEDELEVVYSSDAALKAENTTLKAQVSRLQSDVSALKRDKIRLRDALQSARRSALEIIGTVDGTF